MKSVVGGALASLLMFASVPAHAIITPFPEDLENQLGARLFTGVGRFTSWEGPGTAGNYCGGSLISSRVIITAAHCLPLDPDTYFVLGEGANEVAFGISHYRSWGDLAVARLDNMVTGGFQIYDIYDTYDEIGKTFTMVGGGMTGTLDTGATGGDGRIRYGFNTFDTTAAEHEYAFHSRFDPDLPRPEGLSNVLMYDYDNGNPDNDVFGRFMGIGGLGVVMDGRLRETAMSYGDSGGPDFIDGKIAGIHSFGFSGAVWENPEGTQCGPGSVDPVAPREGIGCHDDSAGDIGASMRVSYYQREIRAYLAAVPEPATWAMMVMGMMSVGGAMRRRRRADAPATA